MFFVNEFPVSCALLTIVLTIDCIVQKHAKCARRRDLSPLATPRRNAYTKSYFLWYKRYNALGGGSTDAQSHPKTQLYRRYFLDRGRDTFDSSRRPAGSPRRFARGRGRNASDITRGGVRPREGYDHGSPQSARSSQRTLDDARRRRRGVSHKRTSGRGLQNRRAGQGRPRRRRPRCCVALPPGM